MKFRNRVKKFVVVILIVALTIFEFPIKSMASTASFSFSGNNSIPTNGSGTIKLVASSPSSGINGLTGTFAIDNPACVTATVSGVNNVQFASSSNKIVYSDMVGDGLVGNKDLLSINLKAGASECSATITISLRGGLVDNSSFSPTLTQEIKVVKATPPPVVKSNDATLKSLTINKGTLSPKFSSGTTSYNVEVDSNVTSVILTAVKNHEKATVNGTTTCNLNATGKTACSVKVTAEDGTTKTYTVNVTKKTVTENPPKEDDPPKEDPPKEDDPPIETKNNDATLKNLEITEGKITPSFNKDEKYYALSVNNSIDKLTINAIPNNEKAQISISGADNLKVGVNPVKVTVIAEDGTTNVYVINVTREEEKTNSSQGSGTTSNQTKPKSSDNFLKDIIISNGDLSPSFSKTTSSYTINVPNEVESLDMKAILNDSKAKVEIIGNDNLKVGLNVITLEVTAEDGSLRIYTINVNKSDKSGETKLKELIVKDKTLSPVFSPDVYEYDLDVENLDKLDISAIPASPNSKVEIIGNDNLKDGNNVILVKVTDENGFVQYYRLNVNKTSKKKFLGLSLMTWLGILGAILLFGLLLFIIILLLKRKKKDENEVTQVDKPIIEFKPEINIGSRNGTDDDYVESGGTLNQFAGSLPESANKVIEEATVKEIPYDIYDDVVTKDELFDALQEATKNRDNTKLKILYAQEMLNRKKEELRKREEKNRE